MEWDVRCCLVMLGEAGNSERNYWRAKETGSKGRGVSQANSVWHSVPCFLSLGGCAGVTWPRLKAHILQGHPALWTTIWGILQVRQRHGRLDVVHFVLSFGYFIELEQDNWQRYSGTDPEALWDGVINPEAVTWEPGSWYWTMASSGDSFGERPELSWRKNV